MFGSRRSHATYSSSPRSGYSTRSSRRAYDTPRSSRGGLFSRRRAPAHTHRTHRTHHTTTTTHRAPATHHRRKPSVGDKISGALMKIKGSLTHRPGVKAAGTRRMHGTDGRGSRRRFGTRRY